MIKYIQVYVNVFYWLTNAGITVTCLFLNLGFCDWAKNAATPVTCFI